MFPNLNVNRPDLTKRVQVSMGGENYITHPILYCNPGFCCSGNSGVGGKERQGNLWGWEKGVGTYKKRGNKKKQITLH